jgi:RNA polymerase sigma-70 factor (ECF subfamily)
MHEHLGKAKYFLRINDPHIAPYAVLVLQPNSSMTTPQNQDHQELLQQAAAGDQKAADQLLELHRGRLRAMIAVRLDKRLSARIDPSDVLQEAMIQAHQKLPRYLQTQPIPLYPWLRRIAWENIVQLHRQHLLAQARAVTREERIDVGLPEESVLDLADRLVAKGSSAARHVVQQEQKARVQKALAQLDPGDREVLALRFLEQLSAEETAAVLEISPEAVKSRQRRALERFSALVDPTIARDMS